MKASIYRIEATEYTASGLDGEVVSHLENHLPAKAFRIPRVGEQVHYGSMYPARCFHGEITAVTLVNGREIRTEE